MEEAAEFHADGKSRGGNAGAAGLQMGTYGRQWSMVTLVAMSMGSGSTCQGCHFPAVWLWDLNAPEPQHPHLENGDNDMTL